MHKTKIFFFMFWRKPCILIPDLYFYGIKIQTNIKQNLVEKYMEKLQFQKKNLIFFSFSFFLVRTQLFGLGPTIRAGPI
jgi:hypothetical protein